MREKKIRREVIPKEDCKLPSTRKQQLKEIFKYDFALIIDMSLILTLFTLPLYAIIGLEISFLAMLQNFTFQNVFPLVFYFGLASILGFAIRGIAKAAIYNLYRLKIFNEGFLIMSKFFTTIKENFSRYLIMSLIVGLCYFGSILGITFFLFNTNNPFAKGLGIGVCTLLFIFIYIMSEYFYNNQNYYVLTVSQNLKNSFTFSLMCLPANLLYFILSFSIPVGLSIINYWVMGVVFIIVALFYDGFVLLLELFYINSRFNKYINLDNYPEYVRRGLAKEEKENG